MPKDTETIDVQRMEAPAFVRAESYDPEARTVDVIWTTGQRRLMRSLFGAFEEELGLDAGEVRLDALNRGAPFLSGHMQRLEDVLGVVVEGSARIENGRGIATIRFSEREEVEAIARDIEAGIIRNVSVGYRVYRYQITERDGEPELWRAIDWEPLEISAVAVGADTEAKFRSGDGARAANPCALVRAGNSNAATAADTQEGMMPNDNRETAAGQSEATEARAAAASGAGQGADATSHEAGAETRAAGAAAAQAAEGATEGERAEGGATHQQTADAARAERERIAQIDMLCERHAMPAEFRRGLIERGSTVDQARGAILDRLAEQDAPAQRRMEPAPAAARGDSSIEVSYRDAMTEALLHRHDPSQPLSDDARQFRGMSLIEMARDALSRRQVETRGMSRMEVASEALAMRSVGYHSTSDFAAILANTVNRTLRAGYDRTPRTFTAWARQAIINDFREVSRTQLSGAPDLQKVLQDGEFQYGTMSDSAETYALATYGTIVSITRQVIINDDLDAFTRIPAMFGAAAADLESDIVYSILSGNPSMSDGRTLFHSNHGNLAGSASAIDEAALAAAYKAMGAQKGLEGRPIRVSPRYIIVPPGTRSVEARKQVTATTPSAPADVNTFANRLEVVEEPRLIPASGAAPWFLAADPARIDTVEFAYLEGQTGVYTETRTGFNVDGVEIKARHDFAAAPIDWRGLFKNAGA